MKTDTQNPYNVRDYFKRKGYKIIEITDRRITEPNFLVEKGKTQRTVDIIEFVDINKSLSQFTYDRIKKNGFFIITPLMADREGKIEEYTKKDIQNVAKTYSIFWKRRE